MYQVKLIEKDTGQELDLGRYRCDTPDEAMKKAETKFKGMFKRLVTRTWSARATACATSAPQKSRQMTDTTPELF